MEAIIEMLKVNAILSTEGIESKLSFNFINGQWICEYADLSSFAFSATWTADSWEELLVKIAANPEGDE